MAGDEDALVISLAGQLAECDRRGSSLVESIDKYNAAHTKRPWYQFWGK